MVNHKRPAMTSHPRYSSLHDLQRDYASERLEEAVQRTGLDLWGTHALHRHERTGKLADMAFVSWTCGLPEGSEATVHIAGAAANYSRAVHTLIGCRRDKLDVYPPHDNKAGTVLELLARTTTLRLLPAWVEHIRYLPEARMRREVDFANDTVKRLINSLDAAACEIADEQAEEKRWAIGLGVTDLPLLTFGAALRFACALALEADSGAPYDIREAAKRADQSTTAAMKALLADYRELAARHVIRHERQAMLAWGRARGGVSAEVELQIDHGRRWGEAARSLKLVS